MQLRWSAVSRLAQGLGCATCIQPLTGLTNGKVLLTHIEAMGTDLRRLKRIDGAGTVAVSHSHERHNMLSMAAGPGSLLSSWCVCCPVHYVATTSSALGGASSTNSPSRIAPADATGLASFILYADSAESALAAEELIRVAAQAARNGEAPLAEASGLSAKMRKERVRSLSMDRRTSPRAGVPAGAFHDEPAPMAMPIKRDRKRSVSFESIEPVPPPTASTSAGQTATAAADTAPSDPYPVNASQMFTTETKPAEHLQRAAETTTEVAGEQAAAGAGAKPACSNSWFA